MYLALDQGGHASRALLFDPHGQVVARALRDIDEYHPRPDWVEQDPEQLVESLIEVIREVLRDVGRRGRDIVAAGLATQRSSIVCWDRINGKALSPVLSWQDRRAGSWLERFRSEADTIQRATGLVLSPHYGASKLRWCLDHLPAAQTAADDHRLAFGPLSSFLTFRLTEERTLGADPANASRTLLWNIESGDWDRYLLHLFGIPRQPLPDMVPTRFGFGQLVCAHSLPLAIVTGDQSAALFARGRPDPDVAYINIGTGAFIQRVQTGFPGVSPPLLTGIVYRDKDDEMFTREGTVNGAGSALAWLQVEAGGPDIAGHLPGWLDQEMEPPLFLNGIGGLASPFWVPDFPSRWIGTGDFASRAVAVAESIVFLIQANLDVLVHQATSPKSLVISGGVAELDGLCQRLSDLSGLAVHRPAEHEATARGLAWLVAGAAGSWLEPESPSIFTPRDNAPFRDRYQRWRGVMKEQTGI